MPIFISHDFENKPEFENITDALAQAGVPYWHPEEIHAGAPLRDQLRAAVSQCEACIFIATHFAVKSSWCGAELGAFWGAGKPVIIYLADSSLQEEHLPPYFKGDVWERRIARVVKRAKELLKNARPDDADEEAKDRAYVGDMTVDELQQLIAGAVSLAAAATKTSSRPAISDELGRAAQDAAESVANVVRSAHPRPPHGPSETWHQHILWVDDRPENNRYERRAFEAMGYTFTLALSTAEALDLLAGERFGAVISDMGRKEGPGAGYALLEAMRASGDETPFFIYAGSNAPQHRREAGERGAQGSTNRAAELFSMITKQLGRSAQSPA